MNDEQMSELDRILKIWSESQISESSEFRLTCNHEEKHYIGFMEEYNFCIKCDAKKINGEWVGRKH